jgi:GNAT superfamily N-acetyltransferase
MVELSNANADAEFEQILDLQRRNLRQALTQQEQNEEGFVYLQHDADILRRMAAELPQAIAVADGRVVGYCLSLSLALRRALPKLEPMYAQFERCSYLGRPLPSYRFFIGGQVCVDRAFRGEGLARGLYHQVRRSLPEPFDLCVTEIAARNRSSIRSHEKIGFRPLLSFDDGAEQWVVVAWDLARAMAEGNGGSAPQTRL